jgi:SCY1-like protein 1
MEEDSFFDAPADASKAKAVGAANPFEDDGEPDFAGWLAAQAGKKTGGKPLPKGLGKPANGSRPVAARSASTGVGVAGAGAKKAAATTAPKLKPVAAKKIDTAPKETGEEDGWGDGW